MGYPIFVADAAPAAILDRRRRVTTPRALQEELTRSLARIHEPIFSRDHDVAGTVRLHARLSASSETPELLTTISDAHAEETARNAASGLNLLDLSQGSDPFVKPMLAYYGCAHLLGALSRALIRWRGDLHSHGMRCEFGKTLEDTFVIIEDRGFFRRLANTLAIFGGGHSGGGYNLFSARDPFDTPLANLAKLRSHPVNNHASRDAVIELLPLPVPDRVSLAALATHDPSLIAHTSRALFRDPAFDLHATVVLVDVLIVFGAGSLCRYRPILWRKVLEGLTSKTWVDIDAAMDRVTNHLTDGVAKAFLSPTGVTGTWGNPYATTLVDSVYRRSRGE
jgi:hypothetical protein